MTDTSMGLSSGSGAPNGLSSEGALTPMAKWSGYCGDCGTWDAHGIECTWCGYDFDAEPRDTSAMGD